MPDFYRWIYGKNLTSLGYKVNTQKLGTLYDTPDVFAFEAHKTGEPLYMEYYFRQEANE